MQGCVILCSSVFTTATVYGEHYQTKPIYKTILLNLYVYFQVSINAVVGSQWIIQHLSNK